MLAGGLEKAAAGGERASGAIHRLGEGSRELADGQRKTAVGSLTLQLGLRTLQPKIQNNALRRSRELATQLAEAAGEDPSLVPQARRSRTLARVIASARDEVRRLRSIADRVNSALNRLVEGGGRLEEGVGKLEGGSEGLTGGLARLGSGAERLAAGLNALQGGAGALQAGLAEGFQRSRPLEVGLRRSSVRISAVANPLARGRRPAPPQLTGPVRLRILRALRARRRFLATAGARRRGGERQRRWPGGADADHLRLRPEHGRVAPSRRPARRRRRQHQARRRAAKPA